MNTKPRHTLLPASCTASGRLMKTMIVITMLCLSSAIKAEIGKTFTWTVTPYTVTYMVTGDNTVQVGDGTNPCINSVFEGTVRIPETVHDPQGNQYTVTKIGDKAFYGCTSIIGIKVPKTITEMGDLAFYECTNMEEVQISDLKAWCNISFQNSYSTPLKYAHHLYLNGTEVTALTIPSGITKIKSYAFFNCESITSVTMPDDVVEIGISTFHGCTQLSTISWSPNITYLGQSAFQDCINLAATELPASLNSLSNNVFQNCKKLAITELPSQLTSVFSYAFSGCEQITSLKIPASLTDVYGGFTNMPNLKTFVVDPANPCLSVVDNVLYRTVNGTKTLVAYPMTKSDYSFTVPSDVTIIGIGAFYGSSLSAITLPRSLNIIHRDAFKGCQNLSSIDIPETVTSLDFYTFQDCTNLSTVTINNSVTTYNNRVFYNISPNATLRVPLGSLPVYNVDPWTNWFKNIVEFDAEYALWVEGTKVKRSTRDNLASGTASYSPVTETLTLNNTQMATYLNDVYCIHNEGIAGLTIEVNGNCKLTSNDPAMVLSGGHTTIEGDGTLNLVSNYREGIRIESYNTLTLKDANVNVTGEYGIMGSGKGNDCRVYVNHSTLVANTFNVYDEHLTISGLDDFELINSVYDEPGFGFDYSYGWVCYWNDEYYSKVSISPYNIPTSISQPQATEPSTSDATYYNLQGQRVDHPAKGIY
nr:leucine-rich repeat domain-containing protein [Prevotella sp.]